MTDEGPRSSNRSTFEAVLAAITAGEYERLVDFMTDDLEFDLPYGPDFLPMPIRGRDTWNQMQLATFAMFRGFTNVPDAIYETTDPDVLVAEYHSQAEVVRNGNEYRNRYIGVLRFRDGKISHWREYHDPRATDVM
jgi:uncharacterized protein